MKWWSLFPAMTSLNVITLTLRNLGQSGNIAINSWRIPRLRNVESPKMEPVLPWINMHQKHEVASDDDLHQESYLQKSYETLLQSNAHDVPSQGDCLRSSPTCLWKLNKRSLDVSKSILPIADEDDFEFCRVLKKRKILLFDKSSDISSGDELDVDLPDLDTFENKSTDEPLLNSTFAENVNELKKFAKSPQSIKRIFSTPVPTSVPIISETATAFTETSCSGASDKCHLYVEFPPFLSEPSSNSWLKRCHGDCEATVSSNWPKVSEFSMSKVAFVKVLFEADAPPGGSIHRSSKQGHVYEETLSEVYSEDASCHMVSFVFRNLTSFKSQPTVALTATLLDYLSYSRLPTDSRSLHRALKGAACLHPHRNDLPFSSKMLFQVLENVSEVNSDQQRFNNTLILDLMVSCLEMEFVVNFQQSSLRGMRKTKLFELFDSTSALRSIQTQLCIACQRYNPKDRDLVCTLPLLQRLLCVADGVVISAVDGVAQIASMLVGEYEACRELSVRVALLESVSFPFHRFVMVRQVLERWRARSMTHSLRSLMVADVGSLLDAYFTDRFLSTLVMEGLLTETAEELVMLLYTLVESYLHMQKDCLASSYWEKIGLNDEMKISLDPSSLSLLPGYVDLLRSFIMHHLSPTETLSRKTCLYLVKLECLADLCV